MNLSYPRQASTYEPQVCGSVLEALRPVWGFTGTLVSLPPRGTARQATHCRIAFMVSGITPKVYYTGVQSQGQKTGKGDYFA